MPKPQSLTTTFGSAACVQNRAPTCDITVRISKTSNSRLGAELCSDLRDSSCVCDAQDTWLANARLGEHNGLVRPSLREESAENVTNVRSQVGFAAPKHWLPLLLRYACTSPNPLRVSSTFPPCVRRRRECSARVCGSTRRVSCLLRRCTVHPSYPSSHTQTP